MTQQGYTVVAFNAVYNEEPVATLIQALHLEEYVRSSRGFTYADGEYRLVFVNEELTAQEKMLVLAHEAGHIACGHFDSRAVIGNDVLQENEANEFSHYLRKPSLGISLLQKAKKHWIAFAAVLLLMAAAVTGLAIWSQKREEALYFGEYYVTETGKKYHNKDCEYVKNKTNIHRFTTEEYDSGEYEPCESCIPQVTDDEASVPSESSVIGAE